MYHDREVRKSLKPSLDMNNDTHFDFHASQNKWHEKAKGLEYENAINPRLA